MKKITILTLFVLFWTGTFAQDNFYFSQYFQAGTAFNPAITGVENFLDIKINYRNQWSGFSDGPSTNYFGVNGYVQKETQTAYKQYSLRTSNPYLLDSMPSVEISLGEKLRHGIGGHIIYDVQGPYEQIAGFLNYALHIPLNNKLKISIGISANITNQRMDYEKIVLRNPGDDELYQALLASGGKSTYLDINPGIMLYGERFYISYAAFKAFHTALSSDEILTSQKNINHNLMVGINLPIAESVKILPSVLYNYSLDYESQWDANLKFLVNEKTWAGLSYRSSGAIVFMAGVYIGNVVNIGYSYDYVTSELNNYTNGSHELSLGLMLFKKDTKAPYLW